MYLLMLYEERFGNRVIEMFLESIDVVFNIVGKG